MNGSGNGNGQKHRDEHRADARLANLRPPWQPGRSPNPGGRPKGVDLKATLLRRLAREEADGRTGMEHFVDALVDEAVTHRNTTAMKLVLEHVIGRPLQAVAVSVQHEGNHRARLAELLGLREDEIPPPEDFLP